MNVGEARLPEPGLDLGWSMDAVKLRGAEVLVSRLDGKAQVDADDVSAPARHDVSEAVGADARVEHELAVQIVGADARLLREISSEEMS